MVKWLHISDIHLNRRGTETRRMRSQLIPFLKQEGISCKYLFITGDLRYAPDGNFDVDTVAFLHNLRKALGVSVENVFVVPGNHDIDRSDSERTAALNTIWNDVDKYYNPKIGVIQENELDGIYQSQSSFNSIMDEFYQDYPERIIKYNNKTQPHFTVTTEDFNIIHVNSTLLYSAEHERDLIVGTDKMMDALESLDIHKPSILLTHYSYDFLSRPEQNEVLNLLVDYNVMIWLAGHEHDENLRRQKDYFYEFQSGNMLYEEGDSNSCFLIGEYNSQEFKGLITGYEWDSKEGWRKMSYISRQKNKSRYVFELDTPDSICTTFNLITSSEDYSSHTNTPYAFEKYDPDSEMILGLPVEESKKIKENFGEISTGDLFHEEQIDNEDLKQMVYLWTHRKNQSIFLNEGTKKTFKGYIYLDSDFAPFMETEITHFQYGLIDNFLLHNDTMEINIVYIEEKYIYLSVGYNLSRYSDVDDRLYHFRKIRKYMNSNHVFVKMVENEQYNLNFNTVLPTNEWGENVALTDYWIDQMQRISKIEQYFGIKFYLPTKASEDDYLTIDVLSDAIEGNSCRSLPAIPMKNPGFKKSFELKEKIYLGNANRLLRLKLFGYTFKPIGQYLLPGKYVWKRKIKGWEADGYDCVPIGVDFEVSYDEELNRKLISIGSIEEYRNEYNLDILPELEGDMEKFFRNYIQLTYDLQKNRQLFLSYQDALNTIIEADGLTKGIKMSSGDYVENKVMINRITDHVISAGRKLIAGIDNMMEKFIDEPSFASKYIEENLGYVWMVTMNEYSVNGHFPISIKPDGEAYYDLNVLKEEGKTDKDFQFVEITEMMQECMEGKVLGELPHYDMMRNYMFGVATIQKNYYEKIEDIVLNYVNTMNKIIDDNPELVQHGKNAADVIVYLLKNDPGCLHIFNRNADVITDYNRFKSEADNHYKLQLLGMKQI